MSLLNTVNKARSLSYFVGLLAVGTTTNTIAAQDVVYEPNSFPAGMSYEEYAADWWTWILAQALEDAAGRPNPLLDLDGQSCDMGQSGDVWYLAGSWVGPIEQRNCEIPADKVIVFPVINGLVAAFPEDPGYQQTDGFLQSLAARNGLRRAENVEVWLDDEPIGDLKHFYVESDFFEYQIPTGSVVGNDTPWSLSNAMGYGYYIALQPLAPGHHRLHFTGETADFSIDVNYELTIVAP